MRSMTLLGVAGLVSCSLIAPSEDEYFGDGVASARDSGVGAASGGAGTAGASSGGASSGGVSSGGASSGGVSSGGASSGGVSSGGVSSGGLSSGGVSSGGVSSGGTPSGGTSSGGCGGCDDKDVCTDDSCNGGTCVHTPNSFSTTKCIYHADQCSQPSWQTYGKVGQAGCGGSLDTLVTCECPSGSVFYTCNGCPPGYTETAKGNHPNCPVTRYTCQKS
ncbi:MAG: hypothetical protein R3B13_34195 [Polyangiaceae bacterium]